MEFSGNGCAMSVVSGNSSMALKELAVPAFNDNYLWLIPLEAPGDTSGHIAYFAPIQDWLCCGDPLFAGGCGRLFEGTPAQMSNSLAKLAALPHATQVFCAHEYPLANLRFAQEVEPANRDL